MKRIFSLFLIFTAPLCAEMMPLAKHFALTQERLCLLSEQNSCVMEAYAELSKHLAMIYKRGEGMIEMDVHQILDALVFAAEGCLECFAHPVHVSTELLVTGHIRDPDILIAALLHRCDYSWEQIHQYFNPRIASFVSEVAEDVNLSKEERRRLQLLHAAHKSAGAAQIDLADKLDTLRTLYSEPPAGWTREQIDAYFLFSEKVTSSLPWVNKPLKEAVDRTITAYWQFQPA